MTIERVFYSLYGSGLDGDLRRADTAMNELAEEKGFVILSATPQTIADGWQFTIEYSERPELPHWVARNRR